MVLNSASNIEGVNFLQRISSYQKKRIHNFKKVGLLLVNLNYF